MANLLAMDEVLKAVADPRRRQILDLVAHEELSAGAVAEHFRLTRPAVSQHLTVLLDAGLVTRRRDGTRRLYRARPEGFAAAMLYLEGFWDDRLGRLARAAVGEPGGAGERLSVRRDVLVPTPPERVWALLTDGSLTERWMGVHARVDPRPGGVYRVEVVPGEVVVGTVVAVDEPRRLVHTWGWQGAGAAVPAGSTLVTWDLLPVTAGTVVRLTHRDLPDLAATGTHARGWQHYLERLEMAARGDAGPDSWVADPTALAAELHAAHPVHPEET